jgi:CheY-like chemotaxis protein
MFNEHFFNILMIDDDQDDHDLFRSGIKDIVVDNFKLSELVRVISVHSGMQGLNYLLKREEYKNNQDNLPDFVVLDLNMPLMDGFSTLQEMRAHSSLREIPVYILTTSKSDEHRKKCIKLNCAGFFSKPSAKKELREIIAQMLKVCSD